MVPPKQEQLDLMQVRSKADCAMRLAGDHGHERHRVGKDVWARCRSEDGYHPIDADPFIGDEIAVD
jgi:hypothetical protein